MNEEKKELNIGDVAEELIMTLKKAVKQCRNTTIKIKRKVVNTEYDEEIKKPIYEVTEESEEVKTLKGTVDIGGLKTIAALLKEIAELQNGDEATENTESAGVVILADVKDAENGEK